jgi:hypothetical protein
VLRGKESAKPPPKTPLVDVGSAQLKGRYVVYAIGGHPVATPDSPVGQDADVRAAACTFPSREVSGKLMLCVFEVPLRPEVPFALDDERAHFDIDAFLVLSWRLKANMFVPEIKTPEEQDVLNVRLDVCLGPTRVAFRQAAEAVRKIEAWHPTSHRIKRSALNVTLAGRCALGADVVGERTARCSASPSLGGR